MTVLGATFRADPVWQLVYLGESKYLWLFYACVSISASLSDTYHTQKKKDNHFSTHPSLLISALQICPVWTCNPWKFPTSWLICKYTHIFLRVREVTFSQRPLVLLICWEFYSSSFTLTHFLASTVTENRTLWNGWISFWPERLTPSFLRSHANRTRVRCI